MIGEYFHLEFSGIDSKFWQSMLNESTTIMATWEQNPQSPLNNSNLGGK